MPNWKELSVKGEATRCSSAYGRINTLEPAARLEAQKLYLARLGADNFFCEKTSVFGSTPELERAITCAGKGDVIAVTKPYRIARTTREVLALVAWSQATAEHPGLTAS